MALLIVLAAVIATALAAPQVIKPVAYAAFPGYSQLAYNPYVAARIPTPIKPYVAPIPTPVRPYVAAPVVPAVQPYLSPAYVKPIAIVRQFQDDNFDGTFTSEFEAENGISNQVSGYVKAISPEEQAQVMQGQYSYTAPDGTPIITRWFADETGFHVEGAHLPENIAQTLPYKTA